MSDEGATCITVETPCRLLLFYPDTTPCAITALLPIQAICKPVGHQVTVGRSSSSDVRLNDERMSRMYASFWHDGKDPFVFRVKNLSERKPVLVDGVMLRFGGEAEVKDGCVVTLDFLQLKARVCAGDIVAFSYQVSLVKDSVVSHVSPQRPDGQVLLPHQASLTSQRFSCNETSRKLISETPRSPDGKALMPRHDIFGYPHFPCSETPGQMNLTDSTRCPDGKVLMPYQEAVVPLQDILGYPNFPCSGEITNAASKVLNPNNQSHNPLRETSGLPVTGSGGPLLLGLLSNMRRCSLESGDHRHVISGLHSAGGVWNRASSADDVGIEYELAENVISSPNATSREHALVGTFSGSCACRGQQANNMHQASSSKAPHQEDILQPSSSNKYHLSPTNINVHTPAENPALFSSEKQFILKSITNKAETQVAPSSVKHPQRPTNTGSQRHNPANASLVSSVRQPLFLNIHSSRSNPENHVASNSFRCPLQTNLNIPPSVSQVENPPAFSQINNQKGPTNLNIHPAGGQAAQFRAESLQHACATAASQEEQATSQAGRSTLVSCNATTALQEANVDPPAWKGALSSRDAAAHSNLPSHSNRVQHAMEKNACSREQTTPAAVNSFCTNTTAASSSRAATFTARGVNASSAWSTLPDMLAPRETCPRRSPVENSEHEWDTDDLNINCYM